MDLNETRVSSPTMSASSQKVDLNILYLHEAAKLVAITSPSTASYLASESIQRGLANGSHHTAFTAHQRQTFCTACGNVFIPGWNCAIIRGDTGSAPAARKGVRRRAIVYQCRACYHHTTFHLPPPPARPDGKSHDKKSARSDTIDLGVEHQSSSDPPIAPPKTSSKKKAKARRDKASLQSLLKKSKEDTSTPSQLSLMDFLMP